MKILTKILKETSHPFISLLPEQEKISQKLAWYNKSKGIIESSSIEILSPIVFCSLYPSINSVLIGAIVIIDGLWRINRLIDDLIPQDTAKYLGTNFLEIPYGIGKKIFK